MKEQTPYTSNTFIMHMQVSGTNIIHKLLLGLRLFVVVYTLVILKLVYKKVIILSIGFNVRLKQVGPLIPIFQLMHTFTHAQVVVSLPFYPLPTFLGIYKNTLNNCTWHNI